CEENIWQLAGDARLAGRGCRVAVISNGERACPLWQQRAAAPGEAVCWDYHVILLAEGSPWEVWDLDTRLGCPVPANVWVEATFPGADGWAARWLPRFRVMTAGEYRRRLSSDR